MTTDHRSNPNRHLFDTLLAETLITPEEHARALAVEPEPGLATPGKALVWMMVAGAIDEDHYNGLFEELAESRKTGIAQGSARRAAIIAEAESVQASVLAAGEAAAAREEGGGSGWKWMAGLLLVGGAALWLFVRPAEVPACTDPAVTATLNNMFHSANRQSGGAMPTGPAGEKLRATIGKISEAGYAAGSRVRGCKGVVSMGGESEPYGFTIALNGNRSSDFKVDGASVEIIDARYGSLDANGHVVHDAAPLGRVELERALRAGVDANQDKLVEQMRNIRAMQNAQRGDMFGVARMNEERQREIADVEPLAPCRELKPGTAYSCRLLIERNDPLLGMMGGTADGAMLSILDSDFTFERDSAAAPWRVSPAFKEEYAKAIVAARMKLMKESAGGAATP